MSARQIILIVAIIGAFGILVPMYKGLDFLDPRLIVAYACLSAVIAAPIVTDTFSQPSENDRLLDLLRAWLYSWAFAAILLTVAFITLNVKHGHGRIILPRTSFLVAVECLSLTLAGAAAGIGALLAMRFSAPNVKAGFRAIFLLAAVALFLADRYGAFAMSIRTMTRVLFIVSALFGAVALTTHVMLKVDASDSHHRRGTGGV